MTRVSPGEWPRLNVARDEYGYGNVRTFRRDCLGRLIPVSGVMADRLLNEAFQPVWFDIATESGKSKRAKVTGV